MASAFRLWININWSLWDIFSGIKDFIPQFYISSYNAILSRREIFVKKINSLAEGNFNLSPGEILGYKKKFF